MGYSSASSQDSLSPDKNSGDKKMGDLTIDLKKFDSLHDEEENTSIDKTNPDDLSIKVHQNSKKTKKFDCKLKNKANVKKEPECINSSKKIPK